MTTNARSQLSHELAFALLSGQVRHLIVDFAGVIGRHQLPSDIASMAALIEIPAEVFERRYWAERLTYDLGESPFEYWAAVAGNELTAPLLTRLVGLDCASWLRLASNVIGALERTAKLGIDLTLLSNAPYPVAAEVRARSELSFFNGMMFSCDLGVAKPDRRIYDYAIASSGHPACATVFVDDRSENVIAAQSAGITSIWFRDAEQLRLP